MFAREWVMVVAMMEALDGLGGYFRLAFGIIGLLGNLITGSPPAADGADTVPVKEEVAEVRVSMGGLVVPEFVKSVPSGHFAGVSAPSGSLHDARRSAIDDVVRQILGAINVRYDHRYTDRVTGSPHSAHRVVDDSLRRFASGVVLDVERGIVQSVEGRDGSGRILCYVLVRYSEAQIQEMRRLSKGAKVVASITADEDGFLSVRVTEVNGVAVTIASADVVVEKKNKFAKAISLFVWKVPDGSRESFSASVGPVRVCSSQRSFSLDLRRFQNKVGDSVLGADLSRMIKLRGFDEIGREVVVEVSG